MSKKIMTIHLPLFINGELVKSSSSKNIEVLNPATQEILCLVPCATEKEIEISCKEGQLLVFRSR